MNSIRKKPFGKLQLFLLLFAVAAATATGCKTKPEQGGPGGGGQHQGDQHSDEQRGKCGDSHLDSGETCDDGNTSSGDGCSSTCQIEDGYTCSTVGELCTEDQPDPLELCGDNHVDTSAGEECDDGNRQGGDGCSASCKVEDNTWKCPPDGGACTKKPGKHPVSMKDNDCGNGKTEAANNETCDDGNLVGGDGCSAICRLEKGWTCTSDGDCTFSDKKCGNGVKDPSEECDWSVENADPKCMRNCKLATCGNGIVELGELCEDGNRLDGDGCSSTCQIEDGYECGIKTGCKIAGCGDGTKTANEECDDGTENKGGYGKCRPDCKLGPHCGDGILYAKNNTETCDDGNNDNGDGCSATCQVESGYTCARPGVLCTKILCGNGVRNEGESCDDGNRNAGDGCSPTCLVEPGYICKDDGTCTARECGDGKVATGEECDDGNLTSGDGCNQYCQVEYGFLCPPLGGKCRKPTCGDSKIEFPEQCDDGNRKAGDGCSEECQFEAGYYCPTVGALCVHAQCGNGKREGYEGCDDGVNNGTAGCSSTCQVMPGWACSETSPGGKSTCHQTVCGDGILEGDEECDDGNVLGGDGCDHSCHAESFFTCRIDQYGKKVCGPVCGDGVTLFDAGEECDDGNKNAGDGCSPDCKVEEGFTCTKFGSTTPPPTITIPMIVRDFKGWDLYANDNGHPDFERFTCQSGTGYLADHLDSEGKPLLGPNGSCFGKGMLKPAESLWYWYHDTKYGKPNEDNPYIKRVKFNLQLDQVGGPSSNTYQVSNTPTVPPNNLQGDFQQYFFPIDGLGWTKPGIAGQETLRNGNHNFNFTDEFKAYFKYTGPATLTFLGDDDLWVFVNGRLALDLGGTRTPTSDSFTLSDKRDSTNSYLYDSNFDLYEGGIYEIKVFHAERHTDRSTFNLTLAGFVNTGTAVCQATCGDGKVAYGYEECDLGSGNSDAKTGKKYTSACSTQCTNNPGWFCTGSDCRRINCGNSILEYPEQCDDGNQKDNDNCSSKCTLPNCGNGQVDTYEECDPNDTSDTSPCSDQCKRPVCGNRQVEAPIEECDDGNQKNDDACSNSCTLPVCGDGIVQGIVGEHCDDGVNSGQYGSCTFDCQSRAAYCGDGVIQSSEGEECDDGTLNGNVNNYNGCSVDCKKTSYCGDGVLQAGEKCDDGNNNDNDGCNSACSVETGYYCCTSKDSTTGECKNDLGQKSECSPFG